MARSRSVSTVSLEPILHGDERRSEPDAARNSSESFCALAIPFVSMASRNCLGTFFSLVPELINVVLIGQFGTVQELGAVGLANCMQNAFALSIAIGLNSAFDLFTSTSGGAGKTRLCMLYLARGRIAITLYFFLIVPLMWYTEVILCALYQPPAVAMFANDCNRASILGLWFLFQWNALERFLQSQGKTRVLTIVQVTVALLHTTWCYFFVGVLGLGNTGVGYANSVSWIVQSMTLEIYFRIRRKSFGVTDSRWLNFHFTSEAWSGMLGYFKVAVPMAVLLWAEWAWWEVMALLAGLLGEVQLAAHVSSMNILTLYFMIPLGLNITTAYFFGHSLGKGDANLARRYMRVCLTVSFAACVLACGTVFLCAKYIARVYTEDPAVLAYLVSLIQIGAFNAVPDGMQNVLSAFVRVCGRQNTAAVIYLVQNFGVAFGLALLFGFYWHDGVIGMWRACTCGLLFGVSLFGALIYFTIDLDDEVSKVKERIARDDKSEPLLSP